MTEAISTPPGYTRLECAGADVVALSTLASAVAQAMEAGTLYEYAEHHPESRILMGRGIAYAVPLPEGAADVVIRHSRHGGLLAPITGDRFRGPTRAPQELDIALHLERAGVPTPEIVAYATYPAGRAFRRADVATREIPDARDLATALADDPDPAVKRALLSATATLLAQLTTAGARHPDLNLKNVLVARDENDRLEALVLDVDRVWFDRPGDPDVTAANLRRFNRSAHKLRRLDAVALEDADLLAIEAMVREAIPFGS